MSSIIHTMLLLLVIQETKSLNLLILNILRGEGMASKLSSGIRQEVEAENPGELW